MSNSQKCTRLQSNLLQQNVYVRDVRTATDIHSPVCKAYPELERKDTQFGFEEKVVVRDYPITPDYVNSFVETADYKNNIEQAIHAPSRGVGLGDIRDMQSVQNLDSVEIQRRIAELQAALQKTSAPVPAPVPAPAPAPANSEKGGVK